MGKDYTNNNFKSPPEDLIQGYYEGLSKVWLPALSLNELDEGAAKPVTLLGREVLMTKLDGNITAMPNYCPHFQARLSEGTVKVLCATASHNPWAKPLMNAFSIEPSQNL